MLRRSLWRSLCVAGRAASGIPTRHGGGEGCGENHSKQKVVYDVSVKTVAQLENVLDRASFLSARTMSEPFDQDRHRAARGEIGFFAIRNNESTGS